MSKFMALFPLNLVAFPEEQLNLHIFEPRYKDLINDCLAGSRRFGIPAYVTNKIEYGTEVEILEVSKTYEDGRMDIKTIGHRVFKVKEYQNPWGEKLYAAGQVEPIENIWDIVEVKYELAQYLRKLYQTLKVDLEVNFDEDTPVFAYGHKVGLNLEQEYQLIQIPRESDRAEFVLRHLKKLLPRLNQADEIREKIKMNGHFRHLDTLDF
jgi:Lon protease-like protein